MPTGEGLLLPDIQDANTDAPVGRMSVVAISNVEVLRKHWADLEVLFSAVAEPNVFYEPWMLIPAVETFGEGKNFAFVLVFAESPVSTGKAMLCGFFPF